MRLNQYFIIRFRCAWCSSHAMQTMMIMHFMTTRSLSGLRTTFTQTIANIMTCEKQSLCYSKSCYSQA